MNAEQLFAKLQSQILTSTPEELATLLFQLSAMKADFQSDELKLKTYQLLFANIAARLHLKTAKWGMA